MYLVSEAGSHLISVLQASQIYKLIYMTYILYSRSSQTRGRAAIFSKRSQELDFISIANEVFMGIITSQRWHLSLVYLLRTFKTTTKKRW